ncbi:DNA-binding response regulator [Paenibacillus antri]|uniref:DNA-binding response regulator n=1 Tax=Paenibacillus antri TaxID=2582848 RepID=A0A5R9GB40_9BACL|nr:DNA-binding response regulator [Paenibacillus antri]TLS52951.1 DNA-binding response regulator [Paenibacillus antri]
MLLFEEQFEAWHRGHVEASAGERRRRLKEKYGDAEKLFLRNVWFPAFKSLDGLFPEHEVLDAEGKTRFMDHAYIAPGFLWGFEVDGYGPHLRDIDRRQFADERRRDVSLKALGWRIARFAFDDVNEKPWVCRRLLEMILGGSAKEREGNAESFSKDRVIRHAMALGGTISIREARGLLGQSDKPTLALLRALVRDGLLEPCSEGAQRVHRYRLRKEALAEYWGTHPYRSPKK